MLPLQLLGRLDRERASNDTYCATSRLNGGRINLRERRKKVWELWRLKVNEMDVQGEVTLVA